MKHEKIVVVVMLLTCAIALLFPPWGFDGRNFERFAFVFTPRVPIEGYERISASIMWPTLGIELGVILFIGMAIYFFIRK